MTKTPDAERQRASRQARAAAGLRRLDLWAHPDDHPALRAEAKRLAKLRQRAQVPAAIARTPL